MKKKKISKWIASLLTAVLLISCMCVPVLAAADTPSLNLGEKGSISVTLADVKDGTLTLYEVATLGLDNGNMAYTKTADFSGYAGDLDVEDSSLADTLAEYVAENSISGTVQSISSSGEVSFTDLTLGLYLIVQTEQSTGFYTIEPFMVTVPIAENNQWVYNVDATPKTEVNPEPTTSPSESPEPSPSSSPSESPEPGTSSNPSESPEPGTSTTPGTSGNGGGSGTTGGTTGGNGSSGGTSGSSGTSGTSGTGSDTLPQTGQLNWPVALFTVLGVILIVIGIILVNTGRKRRHGEA